MISSNQKNDYLKSLVSVLPEKPGVYQFLDAEQKIIYIGKAKNLKKRISSYFTKIHDIGKIRVLVNKIADIKHIIVDTESDSLLLENNLIKKYQPRYNVLLKDDKTFPWICIKNELFPRVFLTRNIIKDGSIYYGPYTSVKMVRTILELIKQLYKLRTCNYKLSENNINKQKFKACLEYHIGNCKAPCIGKQTLEDYAQSITDTKYILKGNINTVTNCLKELMLTFSKNLKYEEAQQIKENIELLQKYQSKSAIVNPSINNIDVFSFIEDSKYAYVNFLKIVNGAVIQVQTFEMKKKLDEKKEDLLPMAIIEIRRRLISNSKEIIVPFKIEYNLPDAKFFVPKRGDKRKLLELSERNAKYYRQEKLKQQENVNAHKYTLRILNGIKKDLHLKELPVHIECFDNSNIQGSNAVGACVVFKNARPSKKDYRHFNIKTVKGADDFASMQEIIYRRYKRLLDEKQRLPQLIVVDGGKGQLSASVKSLDKLSLYGKIAIIGIAKRLEEIYFPDDPIPLYLDKTSVTLRVIQHLRNEAHRFGINFHRKKRSKGLVKSELNDIKGIGNKTVQTLLSEFHSVSKIKEASFEELEKIIGKAKAKLVIDYWKK